jgi:hypothetical protein
MFPFRPKSKPKTPQISEDFINWYIARLETANPEYRKEFLKILKFESALTSYVFLDVFLDLLIAYMLESETEQAFFDDFEGEAKHVLDAVKVHFAKELAQITE